MRGKTDQEIVPSLVDIGRKTRKEYEAEIAERYQVRQSSPLTLSPPLSSLNNL